MERTPMSARDLENVRVRITGGEKLKAIAKAMDRNVSIIGRVHTKMKDGTYAAFLAKAQDREARNGTGKAASNGHGKIHWPKDTVQRRYTVQALVKQGLTYAEIGEKLGVPKNTVYWYATSGGKHHRTTKTKRQKESDKIRRKVHALHAKGLTVTEIAMKLKRPYGSVHHFLYFTPGKQNGVPQPQKENLNGSAADTTSSPINKNVLVGIAYSETERFIGILSERLGLSAEILRPRLSELLGHSPLRQ